MSGAPTFNKEKEKIMHSTESCIHTHQRYLALVHTPQQNASIFCASKKWKYLPILSRSVFCTYSAMQCVHCHNIVRKGNNYVSARQHLACLMLRAGKENVLGCSCCTRNTAPPLSLLISNRKKNYLITKKNNSSVKKKF